MNITATAVYGLSCTVAGMLFLAYSLLRQDVENNFLISIILPIVLGISITQIGNIIERRKK